MDGMNIPPFITAVSKAFRNLRAFTWRTNCKKAKI
jgi:hypothetical protein